MTFETKDELEKHLRHVGECIISEANKIAEIGFLKYTKGISIEAEISPGDSVTTINYTFEKYADYRSQI